MTISGTPTQMPFTDTHNGLSTERNAAEEVMLHLGLDNADFRLRDPIVSIIGRHIDKERSTVRQPPVPAAQPESLSDSLSALLQHPQAVQELVKRLVAVSAAAHAAASCVVERGDRGLSSVDNLSRLWSDLQTTLKRFGSPKTGRVWKAVRMVSDVNRQAMHNRRKHGPVCVGCINQIGFYQDKKLLGVTPMRGRNFQEMRPGDQIETTAVSGLIFKTSTAKRLTVERIEGLMVHLKEPTDERTRAANSQEGAETDGSA